MNDVIEAGLDLARQFAIVVGVSQPLATWLKLPQSVVLAAIGIGIGALPLIAAQFGLLGPFAD